MKIVTNWKEVPHFESDEEEAAFWPARASMCAS